MASPPSLHSQLSSIMETLARAALCQIGQLVDDEAAGLRSELSRLLCENSALAEKVNSLQVELSVERSDASHLCKSYRTVGVQTVSREADPQVPGSPTVQGIYGKEWCMDLWKDRESDPQGRVTVSPQTSDKLTSESDHVTVARIKDEDGVDDGVDDGVRGCGWQQTVWTEGTSGTEHWQWEHGEHGEHGDGAAAAEPEPLKVGYTVDGNGCSLSFDQEGELVESAAAVEEPPEQLITINNTQEAFSAHMIPVEEDDDYDDEEDVVFLHDSQQEHVMNTACVPSNNEEQILAPDNTENSTFPYKYAHDNFNMPGAQTVRDVGKYSFACQTCNRTFQHKRTLAHHMKSHKQNVPNSSRLKSHTYIPPLPSHRLIKYCGMCGKNFSTSSALRTHYVVHTGEKPYRCSLCGKGFTQKGNLKCHLRIHTGERPFHCGICGRTFTQKGNLNHHLMAHRHWEFRQQANSWKRISQR